MLEGEQCIYLLARDVLVLQMKKEMLPTETTDHLVLKIKEKSTPYRNYGSSCVENKREKHSLQKLRITLYCK